MSPSPAVPDPRRWCTLAVLCFSLLVIGLDNTILNVALPTLQRDLGARTMEQAQCRAGVGKATIYRRWASKDELVKEAMRHFSADLPLPDTGSLAGDFAEMSAAPLKIAADRNAALLTPWLLAEASRDGELHAIFSATLVEPRRRVVRIALERARERGEVREDIDVELAIECWPGRSSTGP